MLKEFLREAVSGVIGKQYEELADILDSTKHVNEFLIAKKLDITINQTRNLLYKLSEFGLVSSMRKKDKKKGWYTYFWKVEKIKSLDYLKEIKNKRIEQINQQIHSRETKQFYICERCNIEYTEENALLQNFTCPECGGIFVLKDNSKLVKEFKKHVEKFESQVKEIDSELDKEKGFLGKKWEKEVKKEEKDKAQKRAAKRAAKKSERDLAKKALGKEVKKVVKKSKRIAKKSFKKDKKIINKTKKALKKKVIKKVKKTTKKKKGKKS